MRVIEIISDLKGSLLMTKLKIRLENMLREGVYTRDIMSCLRRKSSRRVRESSWNQVPGIENIQVAEEKSLGYN